MKKLMTSVAILATAGALYAGQKGFQPAERDEILALEPAIQKTKKVFDEAFALTSLKKDTPVNTQAWQNFVDRFASYVKRVGSDDKDLTKPFAAADKAGKEILFVTQAIQSKFPPLGGQKVLPVDPKDIQQLQSKLKQIDTNLVTAKTALDKVFIFSLSKRDVRTALNFVIKKLQDTVSDYTKYLDEKIKTAGQIKK